VLVPLTLRLQTSVMRSIAVAAIALSASPVSTLPTDRLLFDSDRSGNFEIYITPTSGGPAMRLTEGEQYDSWWPRLSPDRSQILFYRTPQGIHDRDFSQTALWRVDSDGGNLRELRPAGTNGWTLQGHAEWSPDGQRIVMFGGLRSNPQIYVTDAEGRNPVAITRRGGSNLDPSWTPDGKRILFTGCPRSFCTPDAYEVYSVAAKPGARPLRLTNDRLRDHDPYMSPNGRHIAWLTQTDSSGPVGVWNIRIADTDGSGVRLLTNDRHINSKPEWSRDGQTIYFHRLEMVAGARFRLWAISPDGRNRRAVETGGAGNDEYPGS
jgi:Tol biopolymer transport system component